MFAPEHLVYHQNVHRDSQTTANFWWYTRCVPTPTEFVFKFWGKTSTAIPETANNSFEIMLSRAVNYLTIVYSRRNLSTVVRSSNHWASIKAWCIRGFASSGHWLASPWKRIYAAVSVSINSPVDKIILHARYSTRIHDIGCRWRKSVIQM